MWFGLQNLKINLKLRFESVVAQPTERTGGVGFGHVFQADVTGVIQFVEAPEQERKINFSRARLIPARVIGDLDVADTGELFADRGGQLALFPLGVIDVVLHPHVGLRNFVEELERLLGAVEKEPRDVEVT